MKNKVQRLALLLLVLTLLPLPLGIAESSGVVQGVFDALLAEDSDYSKTKAAYAEYSPDMTWEETLTDNGFTLSASGSEYLNGSWAFTLDGDYLTATFPSEDYTGSMMATYVLRAVGQYYGMNEQLVTGYIFGMNAKGLDNPWFITETDEAAGTTTMRIYAAGPYDMKELDEMVLDEAVLVFDPLNEDYRSMGANCGKLSVLANGSAEDATILIGEYGELDGLAYQSILNVVSILQPIGWEDFIASWIELKDAETEAYKVILNPSMEAVQEIYEAVPEDYHFIILTFGNTEAE